MLIMFEIDHPVQLKPFWFKSRIMFRIGWLFFAIAVSRLDLKQLSSGRYGWNSKSGFQPYAEAETQPITKVKTSKTTPCGEICSDDFCKYCTKNDTGKCELKEDWSCFKGRKLLST